MHDFIFIFVWTNLTLAQVSPTYFDAERFVTSKDSQIIDVMQLIRFGDADGAIERLKKIVSSEKAPKEALFLLGGQNRLTALDNFNWLAVLIFVITI